MKSFTFKAKPRIPNPPKAVVKSAISLFSNNDNDEGDTATKGNAGLSDRDVVRRMMEAQAKANEEKQAKIMQETDDGGEDLFNYDNWKEEDEMKEKKRMEKKAEKATKLGLSKGLNARGSSTSAVPKTSKYIAGLKAEADKRARMDEAVYERKLQKERDAEEGEFGDKEKFVTNAYKMKLQETAKWREEQKAMESKDEVEDVTKRADLSDFYKNLMTSSTTGFAGAGGRRRRDRSSSPSSSEDGKEEEKQITIIKNQIKKGDDAPPPLKKSKVESLHTPESAAKVPLPPSSFTETKQVQESGVLEGEEGVKSIRMVTKTQTIANSAVIPNIVHKSNPQEAIEAAKARALARKMNKKE